MYHCKENTHSFFFSLSFFLYLFFSPTFSFSLHNYTPRPFNSGQSLLALQPPTPAFIHVTAFSYKCQIWMLWCCRQITPECSSRSSKYIDICPISLISITHTHNLIDQVAYNFWHPFLSTSTKYSLAILHPFSSLLPSPSLRISLVLTFLTSFNITRSPLAYERIV